MTDDAGELGEIVVEAVSEDDEELDEEEIEIEVQRILIRDEARLMAVVSLVCIVVGVLFAAGWFFLAWRTQSQLSGGGRVTSGGGFGSEDADLIDRIEALEQIGILLLFALVLVVAGCGLRLYATRVNAERTD
ncbi:MAG: hypothetical protein QOI95_2960 [Acidimicrobiaceae bacterium]|jgi:hypothetical protein